MAGRLIRTLVDTEQPAGSSETVWDGCDARGRSAPSGNYVARLESGGKIVAVRMSLVR
jgi:flagellar hook assembly protein FlgD